MSTLRPDIHDAWAVLADKTFVKRSITSLAGQLEEGETVMHLLNTMNESGTSGLLVLTGRRLFWHASTWRSTSLVQIPWGPGGSVSFDHGWLTGKLTIRVDGDEWQYSAGKDDGTRFETRLRNHTFTQPLAVAPTWYAPSSSDYHPDPAASRPAGSSEAEIVSAIERLAALRERGALDEEEFRKAKTDLLARLSGGGPTT